MDSWGSCLPECPRRGRNCNPFAPLPEPAAGDRRPPALLKLRESVWRASAPGHIRNAMRVLSCALAAFALFATPARAAVYWTEPQSFGTNAASDVSAAVGADGTTAVVWTEESRNGSTAWLSVDRGTPIRLGGDEDWTDLLPAVTVTPRGDVIAVWDRVIAHQRSGLAYYRNGVQGWLPGDGGHAAQVASDGAGNVTVAWRPGSADDGQPRLYAAMIAASGEVSAPQP